MGVGTRQLTADELSALEDQRDFLLRSIEDLDAEHGVGDVDDHDYETLRDDYISRAAQVIRTIEAHQARLPEARPGRRWRTPAIVAMVLLLAIGAGVLVTRTSGQRRGDDTVTGDVRSSPRAELNQAKALAMQGEFGEAIPMFEEILEQQPDNAEAMAFLGWAQVYTESDPRVGLGALQAALETDPDYATPHVFLADAYLRFAQEQEQTADFFLDRASQQLAALEGMDLSGPVQAFADQLQDAVNEAEGNG